MWWGCEVFYPCHHRKPSLWFTLRVYHVDIIYFSCTPQGRGINHMHPNSCYLKMHIIFRIFMHFLLSPSTTKYPSSLVGLKNYKERLGSRMSCFIFPDNLLLSREEQGCRAILLAWWRFFQWQISPWGSIWAYIWHVFGGMESLMKHTIYILNPQTKTTWMKNVSHREN